ncbi:META domain-containing protein [Sphingomicrobium sp. XHP0239]|uniref:META domain-containing protein n=1 Tax=Sphingomicrobium maritimum TaxID=3133972 RepID=UPI0031CCD436
MKYCVLLAAAATVAACTQPYDDYGDPYGYPPTPPPTGQYPGGPYPDDYGSGERYGNDGYDRYGDGSQVMDPYRAVGTEPFWSLDINPRSMRFEAAGARSVTENTPRVQASYDRDYYRGDRIEVNIIRQRCSDGMSDRIYPDQVQVRVDGREWRGCGAPARFFQQGWESGAAPGYDRYRDDRYGSGRGQYDRYGNDGYGAQGSLARTNWRVTRLNGRPVPDEGFYLNFLPDRMQARFGCNNLNAPYRQQGERLSVDRIASTRMACPDIAAETRASNILSVPMRVRQNGDTLTLSNDRGTIEARRAG